VELLSPAAARRARLRARLALVALAASCCAIAPRAPAQDGDVEYAVKATYLYKFAPFVEWPAGTFAAATDPFVICVAGDDGVGDLVDEAARGQAIGSHPIRVVHRRAGDAETGCQIVYVAQRGVAAAAELERVRGRPVLTVTDGAGDAHGIVNFVVRDNRVRFEIDLAAAAQNRLAVSSKLLNLAVRVRPPPRP
jgi:hypothetical protein